MTYDGYVILYNKNEEYNITNFKFTKDKYKGEIGLVKIDKNNKVVDLNIVYYYESILKQKVDQNDLYYSSDEETHEYNFT
jgi:hypothetical protein|tara:strand:- start:419 stop:658 length:240 start_codon:yes stop_codon:yes gene_type:complete